jgi:hypothetical protein
LAQKASIVEKLTGGAMLIFLSLAILMFTGIVPIPGSGVGLISTGDGAPPADDDKVVVGTTSASLEISVKDYDRPPSDPKAQFSYSTSTNMSVLEVATGNANERYTGYTADSDTDPIITRGIEYVLVPVDTAQSVLESELVFITAERDPTSVNVITHATSTQANLAFLCYDVDTKNELTAASNTSRSTYNLTLSASDNAIKTQCKFEVSAVNSAYALGAIATIAQNDIKAFVPVSLEYGGTIYEFTSGTVPDHMQSLTFSTDILGGQWEDIWLIDGGPLMIYGEGSSSEGRNINRVWIDFNVETSGTDPTFVASGTTNDMMCAITKDINPYIKQDGSYDFNFHDDSDNEVDVGLDETDNMVSFPLFSKDVGVCIDAL